jgi:uncharacterized protein YdeI (YjbR/CyaY-like superfamily)
MIASKFHPKVDTYIAKTQPFAKPILVYLRGLIHKGCPEVEETIKWSRPFFDYRGVILCNMAAFKEHCSFGFWGEEIGAILREAEVAKDGGMGSLGRITNVRDLPPGREMLDWIKKAASFVDTGHHTSPIAARRKVVKAPKPVPDLSPDFAAALRKNKKASAVFKAFSLSCRREYIDWIADAKRPETRGKRIDTAIEWIAEGKQRNWKYQNC